MTIIAVSGTRCESRLWQPWTSQAYIKNYHHGSTSRGKWCNAPWITMLEAVTTGQATRESRLLRPWIGFKTKLSILSANSAGGMVHFHITIPQYTYEIIQLSLTGPSTSPFPIVLKKCGEQIYLSRIRVFLKTLTVFFAFTLRCPNFNLSRKINVNLGLFFKLPNIFWKRKKKLSAGTKWNEHWFRRY